MKRVFIHRMAAGMAVADNCGYDVQTQFDNFVAEEDITIVSVWIHAHFVGDNVTVDGMIESWWQVTLDGTKGHKPVIGVNCTEHYQAVVAAQERLQYQWGENQRNFPAGYGLTMREGEFIYLIGDVRWPPGATAQINCIVSIAYVKGIR